MPKRSVAVLPGLPSVVAPLLGAAFLCVLLASGCGPAGQGHNPGVYPSEIEELAVRRGPRDPVVEAQGRGRQVYEHYCKICHGDEGQGDGFNSGSLETPPRDFSDPIFWESTNSERLTSAVSGGGQAVGKSVLMPAWGRTLTERQIQDVISYLRVFAEQAKPEESD